MDRLIQNVRQAARSLARGPGFAGAAALTLALGIGAVTAIFAVVDSVVLDPLAYPDSDRLVHIEHPVPGQGPDRTWGLSEAGYFHLLEHNRTFDDIAVYQPVRRMTLAGRGRAEYARTARVSGNIFSVLRARPARGRLLAVADNRADRAPLSAAVLGHDFWRTRFGADPEIVGRTIRIEGAPVQVVGVAEPGFRLPDQAVDVWLPVAIDPSNRPINWHRFGAVARLGDGIALGTAHADLERLTARFPEALPEAYSDAFMERTGFGVEVEPLREHVVGDTAALLWVLLGAVGLVLLIACANVANLFLVRMEGRRRELAVRTALGASRRDLAWRYGTESVLLALSAGGLALLLAWGGLQLLPTIAPDTLPRVAEIGLGAESLLLALLVAVATGGAFGLLPLVTSGADLRALRDESRGMTASRGRHVARRALVVGEVALALVLLASAGLLLRTAHNLAGVDPGIEPDGVLTVDVALPAASPAYRDEAAVSRFYHELTARVAALPGVTAVGATTDLPLRDPSGCTFMFTDDPAAEQRNDRCFADWARIAPGYFRAMGIAVDGRAPTWTDVERGRGEVVVSRAFAEQLWPDGSAIGSGVRGNRREPPFYRIVGVADPVRADGLDAPPVARVYYPMVALEGSGLWSRPLAMTLAVKTASAAPAELTPAIRRIVRELEPAAPVGDVRTMTEIVSRSMARTSFAVTLLGIAAVVALILGVIGLYGVIAYVVEQRRGEIGIRMALGAPAGRVRGMIVRQSLALVALGVAVGIAGALAATRALRSMLFEVSATDPVTLAAVSLLLAAVALAASWLPARRAARVDPMVALRTE